MATGNSFAAPHVAGLVACILCPHPGLTPFEVKAILAAAADPPAAGGSDRGGGTGVGGATFRAAHRIAHPAHLRAAFF